MNEKKLEDICELSEDELKEATGGRNNRYRKIGDQYYYWDGGLCPGGDGILERYLCPKCGGVLHMGWGMHFYCDPCDDHWWWEETLVPNLKSKYWIKCSKEDYEKWG